MSDPSPVEAGRDILIAEDSPTQAEGLRHLLDRNGYRVSVAENGRMAMAYLDDHLPALVLSDISMPELDGYELCRLIKADKRLRAIPVILLTSLSDAEDVLEGLACGAESFISKPYSSEYLLARIDRTLADAAGPVSDHPSSVVEIPIPGQRRVITADLRRMASLLISTYEAAINRNTELIQTQADLRTVNEHLEELVAERTAVLTAEIAGRQQAEARSRYLATVLENVSDGVVSTNLKGEVESWNAGAEAMFGYPAEEVIGRPYGEVLVYDYLDGSEAAARAQVRATGRWSGEVRVRGKNGAQMVVWVASAVLNDSAGDMIGFSVVLHDITERQQAEGAVRQAEAKYRTLVEQMPAITYLAALDDSNATLYISPQVERYGYTPAEYLADPDLWSRNIHPDDRERVVAQFSQSRLVKSPVHAEYRLLDHRGRVLWVQDDAVTVWDADGKPLFHQGVVLDISARKQRELELEAFAAVSKALRTAETQAQMLPIVLQQVAVLLDAGGTALAMRDLASDELAVVMGQGEMAEMTGKRLPAGTGTGGQVLKGGQPYVTDDIAADPHYYPLIPLGQTRAVACVPLITSQHVLGVIWAGRVTAFSEVEVRVLSVIAHLAASAIQRAGLHEQTEQRLQRLIALREIDSAIMNTVDLQTTLAILISHVTRQLGVDAADILLYSRGLQVLEYSHGRGFRSTAIEQTRLRLGEGHAGQAALERRRVSVADLRVDPGLFRRATLLAGEAFVTLICLPLIIKGQLVGVLEVFHRTPLDPDADWGGFLETLAGQAAIAVADAWLFADLQRSNTEMLVAYDTTLDGWSAALDLRDKETEGHSQRVCEQTLRLARELGMSDPELVHIRRGALLHDIGKMGVPDSILLKPDKLTEDEWVIMRRHPQLAYELLAPIAFLKPALDIPYCHHEKWDGTGYPRQLKEEGIPLAARIFALVDVWDALRSDRPYRLGWPDEKVLAYIIEQSGQHFDPKVVQAFCELTQGDFGAAITHGEVIS